jgi:hypothetical protein
MAAQAAVTRVTHIATVHWQSDYWIEHQLSALGRYLPGKLRLYAYLDGIDSHWFDSFDVCFTDDSKSHAQKLNHLAEAALQQGAADDLMVFIDGDAFPVADLQDIVAELESYPLIAVQRMENQGDLQPHPCFCITTLGFWRHIGGDWQPGGYWVNSQGRRITDVGGRLLETLEGRGLSWKPLLRSNPKNLHPLWFGVYGGAVYHHGAGFRDKMCRLDAFSGVDGFSRLVLRAQKFLRLQRRIPRVNEMITNWLRNYMRRRNTLVSNRVLHSIDNDPEFSRSLGFIE